MEVNLMSECNKRCEVFSRIVGYFRPVKNWNEGKAEEFKHRKTFKEDVSLKSKFNYPQAVAAKPGCACSRE